MSFDHAHVESFYHLRDFDPEVDGCRGLACFVARSLNPERWARSCSQEHEVYCLGECYAAPAVGTTYPAPLMQVRSREGSVLERLAAAAYTGSLKDYRYLAGYTALTKTLTTSPAAIVREDASLLLPMQMKAILGPTSIVFCWKRILTQSLRQC
jgi:formate dehydrogenase iron-sulfur subunit/NADH-quinone oxidoreductase subunit F